MEHLVEIAIVQRDAPADGERASAHQAINGLRIEMQEQQVATLTGIDLLPPDALCAKPRIPDIDNHRTKRRNSTVSGFEHPELFRRRGKSFRTLVQGRAVFHHYIFIELRM